MAENGAFSNIFVDRGVAEGGSSDEDEEIILYGSEERGGDDFSLASFVAGLAVSSPVSGAGAPSAAVAGTSGKGGSSSNSSSRGAAPQAETQQPSSHSFPRLTVTKAGKGKGKSLASASKNCSENTRIDVRARLKEFQHSTEVKYAFPPGLTSEERAYIHTECKKYGFQSKSYGKGDNRYCTVSKPKAREAKDSEAKTLTLQQESVQHLELLLRKHPPTERELLGNTLQMAVPKRHRRQNGGRKGGQASSSRAELWNEAQVKKALDSLRQRRSSPQCAAIQRTRMSLPIAKKREEILDLVDRNQVILLAGETGCGKTTQVPQFIAEHSWGKGKPCRVVCTQPRRISAISVAERIASERGERIGEGVGYTIRLEKKGTPSSSIVLCTNGVLLRQLVQKGSFDADRHSGLVEGVTHLVVDEIHERDRFADFLLIILKDILPQNPNLKVILMSATLQVDLFSSYFGNCPIISVDGFMFPVEQFYLEDVLKFLGRADGGAHVGFCAPQELERAMMNAFMKGSDEAFQEMLEEALAGGEGAAGMAPYVNAVHNTTGVSALMVASAKGKTDIVETLLENGADPGIVSKDGGTAKDWACKYGHHDLAERLISREEETRKVSNVSEMAAALNQYQMSVNPDEVDLNIITDLVGFLIHPQERFDAIGMGAILVFLPGWDDISRLKGLLERKLQGENISVLCLHSMVPVDEQRMVFVRPPQGTTKIVLATNMAETAITIDDIVYVINSGKHKEKSYDPFSGVSTLQCAWTSRASEKQRKGRAGRCQPGVCFHIYSVALSDSLIEFQAPELKRTALEEVCLQIKVMETNGMAITKSEDSTVKAFLSQAIEPPVQQAIENSLQILENIGALAPGEKLTLLGKHLASLPLPPQLGKLLLYAIIFGCLDSVLTCACFSAYRSPWVTPVEPRARQEADKARQTFANGTSSDHLATVAAFNGWRAAEKQGWGWKYCRQNYVSTGTMRMVDGMRMQLLGGLKDAKVVDSLPASSDYCGYPGVVRAVLGCGYYPQIGFMRRMLFEDYRNMKDKMKPSLLTKRGEVVRVHKGSVISKKSTVAAREDEIDPIFAFDELTRNERGLTVRDCTEVPTVAIAVVAGDLAVETSDPGEDEEGKPATFIILDGWLKYEVPLHYVTYVKCLRCRLNEVFTSLIEKPHEELSEKLKDSISVLTKIMAIETNESLASGYKASRESAQRGGRDGGHGYGDRGRGRGRGRGGERY